MMLFDIPFEIGESVPQRFDYEQLLIFFVNLALPEKNRLHASDVHAGAQSGFDDSRSQVFSFLT